MIFAGFILVTAIFLYSTKHNSVDNIPNGFKPLAQVCSKDSNAQNNANCSIALATRDYTKLYTSQQLVTPYHFYKSNLLNTLNKVCANGFNQLIIDTINSQKEKFSYPISQYNDLFVGNCAYFNSIH